MNSDVHMILQVNKCTGIDNIKCVSQKACQSLF